MCCCGQRGSLIHRVVEYDAAAAPQPWHWEAPSTHASRRAARLRAKYPGFITGVQYTPRHDRPSRGWAKHQRRMKANACR